MLVVNCSGLCLQHHFYKWSGKTYNRMGNIVCKYNFVCCCSSNIDVQEINMSTDNINNVGGNVVGPKTGLNNIGAVSANIFEVISSDVPTHIDDKTKSVCTNDMSSRRQLRNDSCGLKFQYPKSQVHNDTRPFEFSILKNKSPQHGIPRDSKLVKAFSDRNIYASSPDFTKIIHNDLHKDVVNVLESIERERNKALSSITDIVKYGSNGNEGCKEHNIDKVFPLQEAGYYVKFNESGLAQDNLKSASCYDLYSASVHAQNTPSRTTEEESAERSSLRCQNNNCSPVIFRKLMKKRMTSVATRRNMQPTIVKKRPVISNPKQQPPDLPSTLPPLISRHSFAKKNDIHHLIQ